MRSACISVIDYENEAKEAAGVKHCETPGIGIYRLHSFVFWSDGAGPVDPNSLGRGSGLGGSLDKAVRVHLVGCIEH